MKGFRINNNDVSFKKFHLQHFPWSFYTVHSIGLLKTTELFTKFSWNSQVVWWDFFCGEGGGGCNGKDSYLILLILYLGIKREKEIILVGFEVVAYFRNLQNYKNQQVVISVKIEKILVCNSKITIISYQPWLNFNGRRLACEILLSVG